VLRAHCADAGRDPAEATKRATVIGRDFYLVERHIDRLDPWQVAGGVAGSN
jgi:hypothetical protein